MIACLDNKPEATTCRFEYAGPLTEAQLVTVPLMLRLRKLHDYAVLKRTRDLPADFAGPDWLLSLNLRLREWISEYEQSVAAHLPG